MGSGGGADGAYADWPSGRHQSPRFPPLRRLSRHRLHGHQHESKPSHIHVAVMFSSVIKLLLCPLSCGIFDAKVVFSHIKDIVRPSTV